MRFSFNWLKEYVAIDADVQAFADTLTMAGLEVDSIEPAAADFKKIVVGEIIDIQPHPDADRLRVCQVDVNQEAPLTIVCGANNVAIGMKVPAALVGASLPQIKKLKASKLRGVKSFGMLCSASELGLSDSSEGLMALPSDSPNGCCVRELLSLDDHCVDVDLTPNRGDCLSLVGLARETATLYNTPLLSTATSKSVSTPTCADRLTVTLNNPEACPRYVGRVIRNLNTQCETPLWLKEKLRRSDIRSISIVVDVTNYVLLELGQPMHAFDFDALDEAIIVRKAQDNEALELLDGKEVTLLPNTLVVADKSKALALAGIMGGNASSVTPATTSIFLEAAFFNPLHMAGQARRYGLHTDSSHRFERGVDTQLPRQAIERASDLLVSLTGGTLGPIIETENPEYLPTRAPIQLRQKRITRMLGHTIESTTVQRLLEGLGFQVTLQNTQEDDVSWQVIPPSFRFDASIEADLIEEVARIYGYNHLPSRSQNITAFPATEPTAKNIPTLGLKNLLERGYAEAITYSFISEQSHALFFPNTAALRLQNPISEALSVMRTGLWPGLVQALSYNIKRQQPRVKLVETGTCFSTENEAIKEQSVLAGIVTGSHCPDQWSINSQTLDFYDVKADIESILQLSQHKNQYTFEASNTATCLHPGQAARVISLIDGTLLGELGKIHPEFASILDIPEDTFLFECYLKHLKVADNASFHSLPKYPSVSRDLALLVNKTVSAQSLLACIKDSAGQHLSNALIFDVYAGQGIDDAQKSIAFHLTFQDFSRTLTDTEINPIISHILERLTIEYDANLRNI